MMACVGCGGAGESSGVLDSRVDPLSRDHYDHLLSVTEDPDLCVIVLGDLQDVLGRFRELLGILYHRRVDLLALDIPATDAAGLEAFLNTSEVDGDGPLCKVTNSLDGRVLQRTDRFQRHALFDELAPVVVQVYFVLVFCHSLPPYEKRGSHRFPLGFTSPPI